jgi:hypothetical protein
VDSRYAQYVGLTNDGRVVNGLLAQESATAIVFRGQEGKETSVLRTELVELKSTGKSLMPEGLEDDITVQDFADIFAYIKSVPVPHKTFEGNQPLKIIARDGQLSLLARHAEIRGNDIVFEKPFGNIGFWHGADDYVTWQVDLGILRDVDVYLDYACDNNSAGNRFVIEVGEDRLEHVVEATGSWSDYKQIKLGTLKLKNDAKSVVVRPLGIPRSAITDLRAIYFVEAGKPMPAVVGTQPPDLTNPDDVAKFILDESIAASQRQVLLGALSKNQANVIRSMVLGITSKDEEYRRIPWIWQIAIRTARKNEAEGLRQLIEVGLPETGQPLRDWQSVVLGGGVINGLSLEGIWPKDRIDEILKSDPKLAARMEAAVRSAVAMSMDDSVPSGTRYDALRIIAMMPTTENILLLKKYLEQQENDELQMGAVSGLCDVEDAQAGELLVASVRNLSDTNRQLAIAGLMRTAARQSLLCDAIKSGRVDKKWLDEKQLQLILPK